MKKKAFLLAVVTICIAIAASGTLAYFTADDIAHNVITSGGINIEVVEKMKGANGALLDFPKDGIQNILPGSSVSKIVQVQNTGASEAWIRVKVDSTITGADGQALPLRIGQDNVPVMSFIVLDGWIKGQDDFWYYNTRVAPNTMSDKLLDEVQFEFAMGNEYQNCTANIIITAQAVQTANNGNSVMEAKGWPVESAE